MFAAAGLAVLVYDNRGWGRSEAAPGQPRHEIDPWVQVGDYRHAIIHAQNRSKVDPDASACGEPVFGCARLRRRGDGPAGEDGLTGGNLAAVAYSSAAEAKDIVFCRVVIPMPTRVMASQAARDWFVRHLVTP